ncbi:ATPase, T2SS/T4P/T4SS family [Vulcanisaeta souniana]|uniref:ATPase, T2SS/T4P/T4SS family n=1 Tax=Vulcanisaeta souniana TaxID=164452 RepID=UPI0006D0A459|nr:ATPase, T2SS/T4P/T4SS family [Vulcanisaeta souniana]
MKVVMLKEGFIIGMNDFSLIVDRNLAMTNDSAIFLSRLVNDNDDCLLELIRIDNEYLNYLIELTRRVVPSGDYSLSSLLGSRERFLSRFIINDSLRASLLLASIGLGGDLAPIILNANVEDIFITQDSMYINHSKYGICRVLNADPQVIARQFLRIANISGIRISTDNPSGKFSIIINGKRLRVTVDRWPLVEGVSVHVRLHKKPFTISDLVVAGSVNAVEAGRLVMAVRSGYNILIMGPPSSGKTTLLNALDMALPLNLRRIYIDETDESLELPTPSVKVKSLIGKTEEVLKSLHRGGYGILIIGELREREHFEALIHGFNAGLQVMATTHAESIESLVTRLRAFLLSDLIDLSKFVLVTMERVRSTRRVKSIIYPQSFNPDQGKIDVITNIITKMRHYGNSYVNYSIQLNNALGNLGDPE